MKMPSEYRKKAGKKEKYKKMLKNVEKSGFGEPLRGRTFSVLINRHNFNIISSNGNKGRKAGA